MEILFPLVKSYDGGYWTQRVEGPLVSVQINGGSMNSDTTVILKIKVNEYTITDKGPGESKILDLRDHINVVVRTKGVHNYTLHYQAGEAPTLEIEFYLKAFYDNLEDACAAEMQHQMEKGK